MVWLVAVRDEVWQVAMPLPLSTCPPAFEQVIVAAPSLKVTVPVGGPGTEVADEIVKVNVMFCVTVAGFSEETRVAFVPDFETVWVNAELVLGSKLPSPL
jgi:hypothetical protein